MNDKDVFARQVTDRMMQTDYFSQWMGVQVLDIKDGYSKIQMTMRKEMLNGFGIGHGGIAFALADSAFAFACNSDGKMTVALDVSINFPHPTYEGDVITAEAKAVNRTRRTGLYLIEIKNQNNQLVALFKGTCFKTEKVFLPS
ncbi:MAG TPA: hydroxyphenylacetyl-CoA thioesterase PaaI [Chitinophagaceae bacterium]|nr:hydroxyphenylacetyl-CoA thioesterase PaaI [Chitinophagaceae bacterium]